MRNKVFLDTNIVLDILSSSRQHHLEAVALWKQLVIEDIEITISEDMLSTIYYIERDKGKVLEFFELIQNRWQIISYGKETIRKALTFSMKNTSDLEDTLQCLCAKAHGCEYAITNDKKFVDCGIEIVNYERFLK